MTFLEKRTSWSLVRLTSARSYFPIFLAESLIGCLMGQVDRATEAFQQTKGMFLVTQIVKFTRNVFLDEMCRGTCIMVSSLKDLFKGLFIWQSTVLRLGLGKKYSFLVEMGGNLERGV